MRALYYPDINIEYSQKPTGLIVSSHPSLYTKPVPDRTIVHIDVQQTIPDIIEGLTHQQMAKEEFARTSGLFKLLLQGDMSTDAYRRAVTLLCEKSITFQYYLIYTSEFEDKALPEIRKLLNPIREGLDANLKNFRITLNSLPKSKFCMQSGDQLYYSIGLYTRLKDFPIPVHYIEP